METLTKKRGEEGFTLIELLIVIVILGILAAIVVFAVGTTGSNSAAAACKADAKSVEVALEAYKAQNNGSYPTAPSAPTDTGSTGAGWGALLNSGTNNGAPFLRAEPGTSHYVIWWDGTGNVYVATSGSSYPGIPVTAGTGNMNFDTSSGAACSTYAK
jgi:prepilin-type N-terminal cleavage/methylation domain-containing protein